MTINNNALTTRAWIGLNDKGKEETLEWSCLAPINFVYWNNGEPNNVPSEDCVQLVKGLYCSVLSHCPTFASIPDVRDSVCVRVRKRAHVFVWCEITCEFFVHQLTIMFLLRIMLVYQFGVSYCHCLICDSPCRKSFL